MNTKNRHGRFDTIDEMYAFISSDETGEGICAMFMQDGSSIPMVGADMARVDSLREIAQAIANNSQITIKLIRLSVREELEEITPQ